MWGSLNLLKPIQSTRLNFTATSVKPSAQTIPKDASPKDLQVIFLWLFGHPKPHFHKWPGGSGALSDRYQFSILQRPSLQALLSFDSWHGWWVMMSWKICPLCISENGNTRSSMEEVWLKCLLFFKEEHSICCCYFDSHRRYFSKLFTISKDALILGKKKKKVFFCESSPGLPGNPKKKYFW